MLKEQVSGWHIFENFPIWLSKQWKGIGIMESLEKKDWDLVHRSLDVQGYAVIKQVLTETEWICAGNNFS